ncbi:MAG: DNA-binding transcriptional regulator [Caulobacterales bacterium 68-7]|nr:YafY family transcriptional regulator [Caulobacterales bacterium]OJU14100.1 MAG: DNA-binding transcriptional regulator [Caulobacterales bacterium 68-7]
MRHEKAAGLLELARMLASSAEGLTLDEMTERMGVGRRTVERMRDALNDLFPVEIVEEPPTRRFRIPAGLDNLFQTPTAEELAALRRAAEVSGGSTAAALRTLEQKVLSALRAGARRRLAPDLEALVQAEAIAVHAGPRPFEDEEVLSVVRQAIVSLQALSFRYEGGSRRGEAREVTPYGLLFGRSNYLVAAEAGSEAPKTFRLDLIRDPQVLDRAAAPPNGFSLQDFADQSFGIYHDEVQDVVLRIGKGRARDALNWRFHARQTVELQPDETALVRFSASGMRELAWHLFTWGGQVEIVSPPSLKAQMIELLQDALAAHSS